MTAAPYTAEQLAEARRLYEDEMLSVQEIGRRFGIGDYAARSMLRRAGVEVRQRGINGTTRRRPGAAKTGGERYRREKAAADKRIADAAAMLARRKAWEQCGGRWA